MSIEESRIKNLLQEAERIARHQQEISVLRGESFNVFSILRMESRENATHSAFIGELLNPKGSHGCGVVFLKFFLETVGYKGALEYRAAQLTLEKYIGKRDDQTMTGGRIDIYIEDSFGNTISIENKIYARDQHAQIRRYASYNTGKNMVYYLTLSGDHASEESAAGLNAGIDYFHISYRDVIIEWLGKCLKEAADQPVLRESIKQYTVLIKKLTNQLSDAKMADEIKKLIRNNYRAATTIAGEVWQVEVDAAYAFLTDVKIMLEQELKTGWTVTIDDNLNQAWTGLKITHERWNGILVKLEGIPKVPWNTSIYGIHAPETVYDRAAFSKVESLIPFMASGNNTTNHAWPCYRQIMSLATTGNREKLFDTELKKQLVEEVSGKLLELAKECEFHLATIPKIQ